MALEWWKELLLQTWLECNDYFFWLKKEAHTHSCPLARCFHAEIRQILDNKKRKRACVIAKHFKYRFWFTTFAKMSHFLGIWIHQFQWCFRKVARQKGEFVEHPVLVEVLCMIWGRKNPNYIQYYSAFIIWKKSNEFAVQLHIGCVRVCVFYTIIIIAWNWRRRQQRYGKNTCRDATHCQSLCTEKISHSLSPSIR